MDIGTSVYEFECYEDCAIGFRIHELTSDGWKPTYLHHPTVDDIMNLFKQHPNALPMHELDRVMLAKIQPNLTQEMSRILTDYYNRLNGGSGSCRRQT